MYRGHDLELSGSRDVINHVNIRFAITISYRCSSATDTLISNRFRVIKDQIHRGHDLDLSGSRDVNGHVTIRFAIILLPRARVRIKRSYVT